MIVVTERRVHRGDGERRAVTPRAQLARRHQRPHRHLRTRQRDVVNHGRSDRIAVLLMDHHQHRDLTFGLLCLDGDGDVKVDLIAGIQHIDLRT